MSLAARLWSPSSVRQRPPATELELSPIKAVELRASQIPGVVSLAQGIPSFDTPEPIKQFVQQKIAEGACAKYSVTPGLPVLREAIAEALLAEGMSYDPDKEIIVTAGSIEAIAATLLACIEPGDEVLVVSPTYASYLPAIQIAGGVARFVPLDEDANFDLDPDAIAEAVGRRTRALLLCNPNNPTGTVFSRSQTLRMLAVAELRNLLVITDEVYKDFVYGDATVFSAAREPSARHRVVRVFSFSKAYAMTGWRVGFVHGPETYLRQILKVHDALVTCAPVVSQYAALAALELGDESIAAFRAEFRRRRDHVLSRLDALPHVFDFQKPNASYFVFPRVKDTVPFARDSRRLADEILERAHVALVPGVAFGPTGEAHLRLCYARPADDIDRAFDRLDDFFAGRAPRLGVSVLPAAPVVSRPPWYRLRGVGIALLRRLARRYVRRTQPRVVAITGSQGKTVLKRTLNDILSKGYRVRANPLSHNTAIGLPLAILGCELDTRRFLSALQGLLRAASVAFVGSKRDDVLILELGIRQAGDMAAHLEIVRPEIAIVTPLVPSFSTDHEALAVLRQEVVTLCRAIEGDGRGVVLLCRDDPALATLAQEFARARLYAKDEAVYEGDRWVLQTESGRFHSSCDLVGASSLYAFAAAIRAAQALGMEGAAIERALNPGG